MKELKITEKIKEPLFDRTKVTFEIAQGREAVPSRLQVRELLSKTMKKDKEVIVIRKINSDFGSSNTKGIALVYNSKGSVSKIEPEYTRKRLEVKEKAIAKAKEEKAAEVKEQKSEEKKEESPEKGEERESSEDSKEESKSEEKKEAAEEDKKE